jgi:hypothetical protein
MEYSWNMMELSKEYSWMHPLAIKYGGWEIPQLAMEV